MRLTRVSCWGNFLLVYGSLISMYMRSSFHFSTSTMLPWNVLLADITYGSYSHVCSTCSTSNITYSYNLFISLKYRDGECQSNKYFPWPCFVSLKLNITPSFVIEISSIFPPEQMGQAWILPLFFILCLSTDLKTVILHKQVSQITNWQPILLHTELWIRVSALDIIECISHCSTLRIAFCRIRSYRSSWSIICAFVKKEKSSLQQLRYCILNAPKSNLPMVPRVWTSTSSLKLNFKRIQW
jgi:hypothetical protein